MSLEDKLRLAMATEIADSPDDVPSRRTCTALQACVIANGDISEVALGVEDVQNTPVTPTSVFDIASVTKLFTATLALIAIDQGRINFDTPVDRFYELAGPAPTLLHLLNHSSGLPAWDKFYLRYPLVPTDLQAQETRESILAEILSVPRNPPGFEHVYSDLGYILLGRLVEKLFDEPLDSLVRRLISEPLDLTQTRFVNQLAGDAAIRAVVTEETEGRPKPVRGLVHDENCFIQGGVAGHAGVFSTAREVGSFGHEMLRVFNGEQGILSPNTLRVAWSEHSRAPRGHHVAGWDTPSGETTSVGRGFARDATFGHLGFTGTSLWIDTSRGVVAALMTNRVFPTRENPRIKETRIRFHEVVLSPLGN